MSVQLAYGLKPIILCCLLFAYCICLISPSWPSIAFAASAFLFWDCHNLCMTKFSTSMTSRRFQPNTRHMWALCCVDTVGLLDGRIGTVLERWRATRVAVYSRGMAVYSRGRHPLKCGRGSKMFMQIINIGQQASWKGNATPITVIFSGCSNILHNVRVYFVQRVAVTHYTVVLHLAWLVQLAT